MSLRSNARLGLALAVVVVGLLAFPSTGAAEPAFPVQQFGADEGIDHASAGAFDDDGQAAYVTSNGPNPTLFIFEYRDIGGSRSNNKKWVKIGSIPLPAGTDPISMSVDNDGYIHIVDFDGKREIIVDPDADDGSVPRPVITDIRPLPGQQPIEEGFGFFGRLLADFGFFADPGVVRFGAGFGSEVPYPVDQPDLPKWNGLDLLPDLKSHTYEIMGRPRAAAARSRTIQSMFVLIDANNNRLAGISDTRSPRFVYFAPGPPAATGALPPRDLAVSPLNYNRRFNGVGRHPIIVPVPGVGNVFVLRNRVWKPLSSTPFGKPQGVAASCTSVLVTDYANRVVTFFNFDQPKAAVCEGLVAVALSGGRISSPKVLVKPYRNFTGTVSLAFKGKGKTGARKTRLKAGRIKTVRLKFSRRASARIARALRRHRSIKGTLTLRLKNKAGQKFTVKRRVRIKRG